jgi:hypothetical protein
MRSLACISLSVLSLSAIAGPGTGSVFTTGPTSDHQSVYAGVLNPALGELMVPADEHFRLGFTPSLTTVAEVGQVDNFAEELDDLINLIDDPASSSEPVQSLLDRFNVALNKMGDAGYIKNTTSLHFPLMPLYWKLPLWDGTLMADLKPRQSDSRSSIRCAFKLRRTKSIVYHCICGLFKRRHPNGICRGLFARLV